MNLRQVYNVGRREYISRVRNKAFIFTTLLVPLFLGVYLVVLPLLFSGAGAAELKLAVIDAGSGLGEKLAQRLKSIQKPKVEVTEIVQARGAGEAVRSPYNKAVRSQKIDGYILLTPDPEIKAAARYFARQTGNPVVLRRLEDALKSTVLEELLAGSGIDVTQVRKIQRSDLETVTISDEGEEAGGFEAAFFSTLAFGMLLYMAVLINGQGMAMAIVEEKSSRLIEVILGAVTALEFMSGKIIGVLLSGLTQLGIWILCALIAVLYAIPALAIGGSGKGFDLASILSLRMLFYFAVFFALGYLLYSTLFAAVAATCTSPQELSQAMLPAMFPFIIAFMATFYAVPNPNTLVTRVLSLIPLFTPLVMLARVNVLMPPLWEVWLGILLLALGALAAAWMAAKIFRFALLMHGKRPSLPEIVRMIRAS
ncbi:MAG: ABC transporter permease [Acidobacteriota bacterium]